MTLALKIHIVEQNVRKMMQFDPSTMVFDACRIIREKITEANLGQGKKCPKLRLIHIYLVCCEHSNFKEITVLLY